MKKIKILPHIIAFHSYMLVSLLLIYIFNKSGILWTTDVMLDELYNMAFEYLKLYYWIIIPMDIFILYTQYKSTQYNDYCYLSTNKVDNTFLISTLIIGSLLIAYIFINTYNTMWLITMIAWIMSLVIFNYLYLLKANILE